MLAAGFITAGVVSNWFVPAGFIPAGFVSTVVHSLAEHGWLDRNSEWYPGISWRSAANGDTGAVAEINSITGFCCQHNAA